MRKHFFFILMLTMILSASGSLADEARDISDDVTFKAKSNTGTLHRLTDRKYSSSWTSGQNGDALEIISSSPFFGLYISWAKEPRAFVIETHVNNAWETVKTYEADVRTHQYYPLQGQRQVRIRPLKGSNKHFSIQEIFVLSDGELPSWVQQWAPTYEDADMMLLFAHPDDEVLFFGGLLPYYAAERGLKVLPVLFTDAGAVRRSELLDCLWSLGLRHYPVLSSFPDMYAWHLKEAYEKYGKNTSLRFVVEQIRKYKPEVIITHDIGGEYGHGAHRLCADLAIRSIDTVNDPNYHKTSYEQYGGFDIQKLYLHLYDQNTIEMDWDQPLSHFGGKTGFELASEAYASFHLSQHKYDQYQVEPRNSKFSSYRFGLYYSMVGPDMLKNDMMENIVVTNQLEED